MRIILLFGFAVCLIFSGGPGWGIFKALVYWKSVMRLSGMMSEG